MACFHRLLITLLPLYLFNMGVLGGHTQESFTIRPRLRTMGPTHKINGCNVLNIDTKSHYRPLFSQLRIQDN